MTRRHGALALAALAMTAETTNKEIYAQSEFDQWAFREDLEPGEKFMIGRYLDPRASTLEAGTGGGRLLLAMQAAGFDDLHGFDFVPEFVEVARRRDARGTIDYQVQDARQLEYSDATFTQLVYLQQVLCFIPTEDDRRRAVAEAVRVLRPGGTMVVSLLSLRTRRQSSMYRPLIAYLYALRKLTFNRRSMHSLPWLRLQGKMNWKALLDAPPYIYWYDEAEAESLFRSAGLQVTGIGSDCQVDAGNLLSSAADLEHAPFTGRLYLACRKP